MENTENIENVVVIKIRQKVTDYAYTHILSLNKGTIQEQLPLNQKVRVLNKEYVVTEHNKRSGAVYIHQLLKNSVSKTKRMVVTDRVVEYKTDTRG